MIGWTVKASSRSGARGSRTRLRSAITSVSETSRLIAALLLVLARRSSAAWPVSARNTSSSVGRRSAEVVDVRRPPRRAGARPRRSRPRAGAPVTRTRPSSAAGGSSDIGASASRAALGRRRVGEPDLQPLAADAVLELVRRALGDHLAVVDDRDLVGQPVGLVEVLGGEQHGRALGDEALDRLPQAEPAARVQAGRRLVEEEHRRLGDERRREVEPPAHAAGVGLGRAVGGVDEVEALEQLAPRALGLGRAACRRAGRPSSRFSSPVRFSSTAAYWPASPICSRSRAASRTTSSPATRALPASGLSSVVSTRTAVVLPAPFGPSSPSTVPGAASRSTPSSARTSPNDLTRPETLIAGLRAGRRARPAPRRLRSWGGGAWPQLYAASRTGTVRSS